MALNQGKLLESLGKLVAANNPAEFIYEFLEIFGTPKATTARLRAGGDTRNIGRDGDVGIKKKLYYRALTEAVTPELLDGLVADELIARNEVRFVILTDFKRLVAKDLVAKESLDIAFDELPKNYYFFLPLTGQFEKAVVHSEHPADLRASEKMGQLFDLIRERNKLESKEDIHALNVFLTRLLFCFYAEDTDIFKKGLVRETLKSVTKEDGSDLDQFFYTLFSVLNLPENDKARQQLPVHFRGFPYVNGGLFESDQPIPDFGPKSRRILIECSELNWAEINPDIFGSMFQAVIDQEQRGNLGQHYTSVSNIMKVIQPLFLDKLYEELEVSHHSKPKLEALLIRLQRIRIFDPACGSGNFLIIAFKELRKFEIEVLKALNTISGQKVFFMSGIQLSQFYGIEIDDFAHEIAILSLWLAEHQMSKVFASQFGHTDPMLPLKESGHIFRGDSLTMNWKEVCPQEDSSGPLEVYLCGNPPFLGSGGRSDEQNESMEKVFESFPKFKMLDFVACWFWKGAQYIQTGNCEMALVATNSVTQGEQVAMLWPYIFNKNIKIRFAYTSFPWRSNSKDSAGVHVVIIGLSRFDSKKYLFEEHLGTLSRKLVVNISPYLIEGSDITVASYERPLAKQRPMTYGNKAVDGGNLFLTTEERNEFIARYPADAHLVRRVLGTDEFLSNTFRYCLWLEGCELADLNKNPFIAKRIEAVRAMRLASKKAQTREIAAIPHLFGQIRQPKNCNYLLVPRVSSARRTYVPVGFFASDVVPTDLAQYVENADLCDFAILSSLIHNDWMRAVCGRLGMGYRYSPTLVYNTFPWPKVDAAQRAELEALAEHVLLIREDYPEKTLADLYDPDEMPKPLKEAHAILDMAVDALYRKKPFADGAERLSHLFGLYQDLMIDLAKNRTHKSK